MDEVYTCICGNQEWSIHERIVRCTKCGKEYKYCDIDEYVTYEPISPGEFNRRKNLMKECEVKVRNY